MDKIALDGLRRCHQHHVLNLLDTPCSFRELVVTNACGGRYSLLRRSFRVRKPGQIETSVSPVEYGNDRLYFEGSYRGMASRSLIFGSGFSFLLFASAVAIASKLFTAPVNTSDAISSTPPTQGSP